MKILVIDGQGGGIGKLIVEELLKQNVLADILVCGTNALATSLMLKAGAKAGVTGENAICFNCQTADIIIGALGIIMPNGLMGELSPLMANAIGQSRAKKILIPMNRCNTTIVGVMDKGLNEFVYEAVSLITA